MTIQNRKSEDCVVFKLKNKINRRVRNTLFSHTRHHCTHLQKQHLIREKPTFPKLKRQENKSFQFLIRQQTLGPDFDFDALLHRPAGLSR